MPNVEVKFKKKAYNESTDAGNGIIVFDTTNNKIYVGGVCYSSNVADASYSNGTLTITKKDGTSQDVIVPDMLGSFEDVTITNPTSGQSLVYNGTSWVNQNVSVELAENVTYSQLVSKIAANSGAGSLEPGKLYRITDYVTTTKNGENPDIAGSATYKSAGHQFDLIVLAVSTNKLDCQAKAVLHSGDTYFSNADLSKWQIWYDINNDTNKYEWADSTNGKGVIYRMIDEFENDVPYDFKNILYKIKLDSTGQYDINGTNNWVYTFNSYWYRLQINFDSSKLPLEIWDENGPGPASQLPKCIKNIISKRIDENQELSIQELNNNIFLDIYTDAEFEGTCYEPFCVSNILYTNCSNNIFGSYTRHNTLKSFCTNNTFGGNCYNNTLGNECGGNTFGDSNYNNTFGNQCNNNTFGRSCCSNTFVNECGINTFGNHCSSNTFHTQCFHNTFGDDCYNNTFNYYCTFNTFGNLCINNTFGHSCTYIKFGNSNNQGGDYIQFVRVESGNGNIRLYNSTVNDSNYLQNIYIAQGANNSSTYLDISTIARNLNYRTTVARATDGTIRIYNEDDPVSGGGGDELTSNKVTSLSAQSTDTQYPSAKCVYDLIGPIDSALDAILNGSSN